MPLTSDRNTSFNYFFCLRVYSILICKCNRSNTAICHNSAARNNIRTHTRSMLHCNFIKQKDKNTSGYSHEVWHSTFSTLSTSSISQQFYTVVSNRWVATHIGLQRSGCGVANGPNRSLRLEFLEQRKLTFCNIRKTKTRIDFCAFQIISVIFFIQFVLYSFC